MDYLEFRELYHSQLDKEKARIVSQYQVINEDFYQDLPNIVRNILDEIKWRFRQEDWFPEAWEKYRQHVLEAGLGGEIKMPGYIFKPYLEQYVDEHSAEFESNLRECRYSDMEIGEYLAHHGIKGQKWGIRRFQNEDGTLTAEGKKRYQVNQYDGSMSKEGKKLYKQDLKLDKLSKSEKQSLVKAATDGAGKGITLGMLAGATGGFVAGTLYDDWVEGVIAGTILGVGAAATGSLLGAIGNVSANAIKNKQIDKAKRIPTPYEQLPRGNQPWDEKPSKKQPWDEKPSRPVGRI